MNFNLHREQDAPDIAIIHVSNPDAIDFTGLGLIAAVGQKKECIAVIDESLELTGGLESMAFDPRGAVPGSRLLVGPDGTVRQQMLPLGRGLQSDEAWVESVAQMPGRFATLLEEANTMVRHGGFARLTASFMAVCYRHVGVANIRVVERLSRKLTTDVDQLVEQLRRLTGVLKPGEMREFSLGGYVSDGIHAYRYVSRSLDGRILLHSRGRNIHGADLEAVIRPGVELRGPLDSIHVASHRGYFLGHIPFFLGIVAPEDGGGPLAVEVACSLFRRSGSRLEKGEVSGVLLDEYAADPDIHSHLRSLVGDERWLFDAARWIARLRNPTAERWAWSQRGAAGVVQRIKAQPERLTSLPNSPFRGLLEPLAELERLAREAHISGHAPVDLELTRLALAIRENFSRSSRVLIEVGVPLRRLETTDGSGYEFIRRRLAAISDVADVLDRLGLLRAVATRGVELIVRGTMIFADTLGRASVPTLAMIGGYNVLRNFANEHRDTLLERVTDLRRLEII